MTRRSCSSSSTSRTVVPLPARPAGVPSGMAASSSSSMSMENSAASSAAAPAAGAGGGGGVRARPRAPGRAGRAGRRLPPWTRAGAARRERRSPAAAPRGWTRPASTWRSPLSQSDRIPLAPRVLGDLLGGGPLADQRSSSGFMVSTSTMLNRPRYPVMAHSGQPTACTAASRRGRIARTARAPARSLASRQTVHSRRISRCATTPRSAEAILYGLHPHVHQPGHRVGRVVGVQRGEHQVAGERRLHRDLRGLLVADLADQHHVGVLPQDRAQRGGEGEPRLLVHLHLHDVLAQPVLDRVLDRDDVDARRSGSGGARSRASWSCPSRWAR